MLFLFLRQWWIHIAIFTIRSHSLSFIFPKFEDFNFSSDFFGNPVVFKILLSSFSKSLYKSPVGGPIITTSADSGSSSWIWFTASDKKRCWVCWTFNTCHNYLSFTIQSICKFKRVKCLIMSKESVHTFQKVSSRRNSAFTCVYKITTCVDFYNWLSHCLHL